MNPEAFAAPDGSGSTRIEDTRGVPRRRNTVDLTMSFEGDRLDCFISYSNPVVCRQPKRFFRTSSMQGKAGRARTTVNFVGLETKGGRSRPYKTVVLYTAS